MGQITKILNLKKSGHNSCNKIDETKLTREKLLFFQSNCLLFTKYEKKNGMLDWWNEISCEHGGALLLKEVLPIIFLSLF